MNLKTKAKKNWRRCASCGRVVLIPPSGPVGRSCKKCGEPLSTSRAAN